MPVDVLERVCTGVTRSVAPLGEVAFPGTYDSTYDSSYIPV